MSISSITLTNPGAETGDTTGWTVVSGGMQSVTSGFSGFGTPHSGSRFFSPSSGAHNDEWYQQITIDGAYHAAIDAGNSSVVPSCWIWTISNFDIGAFYIEAYDSGVVLLDRLESDYYRQTGGWTQISLAAWRLPANTRYLRIGSKIVYEAGLNADVYWDDYALTISDDAEADYPPRGYQLGAYVLGNYASGGLKATQAGYMATAAAETSNGLFYIKAYQLGAYALVKGFPDRRDLRAWTFTQDDHDFYVLNLGTALTLVYDKLTQQWCQWKSPDYAYWRGVDGVAWEGMNLACDSISGKIWEIDPEGRLDYETTSIRSQITGYITQRLRQSTPVWMAELAVSEGQPPSSIDASTVGITLRTSDSDSQDFIDHGEVTGEALGEDITVRWFGLGLMKQPGRTFEIVDTGYARRIDGLSIELGGSDE